MSEITRYQMHVGIDTDNRTVTREVVAYADHAAREAEWQRERAGLFAKVEQANREAWNARLERQKLKEVIATPDLLFTSQIECAAAEPLRQARAQLQAAEQANGELREALARVRANASIPHRIKQIVDEALGAAS